jgi:diguanylate cyclase (GGDEF)-like protein
MAIEPDKRFLRSVRREPLWSDSHRLSLLANRLARSLELGDLLASVTEEIGGELALAGLMVESPLLDEQTVFGDAAPFSTSRRLVVEDRDVATITFMCTRSIHRESDRLLDALMEALRYPLRNALLYRQALQCALRDPLTGVYNRAALDSDLGRELRLSLRFGQPLCLLRVGVDDFSGLVESYGAEFGDLVVKSTAGKLLENLRNTDRVFRYAQDEFVVALNGTNLQGATRVAERIGESIEALRVGKDNVSVVVVVSIGVTDLRSTDDATTLIGRAGQALDEARAKGRGRIVRR